MSFEDDLKAPVERDWADVEVLLNGHVHLFRFTALDGLTWANECDKAPVRPGVTIDARYGYDLRQLTLAVAPLCGVRVVDGELVKLRVDQGPKASVDEWADLFSKIDGATFRRISDTIWALNEYLPLEAVEAAKKALAGSGETSASRAPSGSRRAASSGGSRKKPRSSSTPKTAA